MSESIDDPPALGLLFGIPEAIYARKRQAGNRPQARRTGTVTHPGDYSQNDTVVVIVRNSIPDTAPLSCQHAAPEPCAAL